MRVDAASTDDREQLKKEITQELRQDARRRQALGCLWSLFVTLLLTVAPIVYVAAQVAKTGFVDVPVLSAHLYHSSSPVRTVTPLAGTKTEDLYRVIGTQTKFDPSTSKATVTVTETQMTTLMQRAIDNAQPDTMPVPLRTAQIAVDADAVELFAVSPQDQRDATIKERFRPIVKGGVFSAEVERVEVGSFVVPNKFANFAFSILGSQALGAVQDALNQIGELQSVQLGAGSLSFSVHVTQR